tara:strand:+ start:194 stop:451 length:258 start_codon:yes stop_codon:yes gene_type:complete
MAGIVSLEDFFLSYDQRGWFAQFEAVIEDAVLVRPATLIDPPEFGNALCRGTILLSDDTWFNYITPGEQLQLAKEVDEWVPVSGD